jgi:hypothetical protein
MRNPEIEETGSLCELLRYTLSLTDDERDNLLNELRQRRADGDIKRPLSDLTNPVELGCRDGGL